MNALTIRSRLAFAFTGVFGLIFAGFALLVYTNSRDAALTKLDASLRSWAGRIEAEVEEQSAEGVFPAPQEFRSLSPADLTGQRFMLRALDGRVVIDDSLLSPVSPAGSLQTCSIGGEACRVYAGPVEVDDTAAYVLTASASTAGVESALERLRVFLLVTVPAVLLLAAVAAWLIARSALSPVSSMIATARKISADNLGARLDLPRTQDEIRLLGETLNGMMDRIEDAFKAQRQFIADASHEIRTPLTIIRSDLELLGKRSTEGRRTKEIGRIVGQVDRLSAMAENLLLLSRLEAAPASLDFRRMRIDETIVECVREMTPLFREKGVALGVRIDEGLEIMGDREGMRRTILNLLDNSLKFTKRRGRVQISLGNEEGADLPVTVNVQDTGCGIPPADLPHIFNRFFRSGEHRGEGVGSGLGLAIVDQIVKSHRGTVAVESQPGKGTVVALRFPLPA
ncbi:MAG TPA: HAMP domain-containing sensor histidine kinase [Bacteroidota bacterium]|nr:HAMP domain-containing sensor histidine kinase [Bacteroidota bacterium]